MPFLFALAFIVGLVVSWIYLKRKYQTALKQALYKSGSEYVEQIKGLESNLQQANQKVADLEYLIKEREKDIAALKSRRD